jgi:hypothetical protein
VNSSELVFPFAAIVVYAQNQASEDCPTKEVNVLQKHKAADRSMAIISSIGTF